MEKMQIKTPPHILAMRIADYIDDPGVVRYMDAHDIQTVGQAVEQQKTIPQKYFWPIKQKICYEVLQIKEV